MDAALTRWVEQARPVAEAAVSDSANARWWRCGGTWFVGVNALANEADGSVAGGAPLDGRAVRFIRDVLGMSDLPWDRAQVSVVCAGYPRKMESESAAAFRFRRERDAAHLDGVLRHGPGRRRYLRTFHAFILGVPMADVHADNSPLVVWERSHEIVREAFRDRFGKIPEDLWPNEDITDLYQTVRRTIFDNCKRVVVTARAGEAYLVHRLALHGIAPWSQSSASANAGRMVVYFRPELRSPQTWLNAP